MTQQSGATNGLTGEQTESRPRQELAHIEAQAWSLTTLGSQRGSGSTATMTTTTVVASQ